MLYNITSMGTLKNDTHKLIYKTGTDSKTENKAMVTKRERFGEGGGINQEFGRNVDILLCISKEGPAAQHRELDYLVIIYMEKESKKYICI